MSNGTDVRDIALATEPVRRLPGDPENPRLEPGMALCMSGGGYRAMVFHVGALWRLHETGLLYDLKRVSSVSGGSITAGVLGLNWSKLNASRTLETFRECVVKPIRHIAGETIDRGSILGGVFLPGTISDRIAKAYSDLFFKDHTLQDLPDNPRFVINATNVQSGALWRFSKPYMGDWRVGLVMNPKVALATAVAASSAFPPVLSPAKLELKHEDFAPGSGTDLQKPPYTTDVYLSDGGVYDNLGLETAWKRYETILVSDAGGKMTDEPEPKEDWAQHAIRVLDVIDNQVRSLRKRQLIEAYKRGAKNGGRGGTYFGIRTNIKDYGLATAWDFPHEASLKLAAIQTRLRAMDASEQKALINWGYAVCDAAIRTHVKTDLEPPKSLPF